MIVLQIWLALSFVFILGFITGAMFNWKERHHD